MRKSLRCNGLSRYLTQVSAPLGWTNSNAADGLPACISFIRNAIGKN